jgi:serine/threonine protein kinase/tetratricopeptide (TPR) repeat protein
MQELIGKSLGKYRIVQRLARGGMAEIYKAYQNNLDRYVAIKIMHAYLTSDPGFVARFEREAKSIAALHHPHIVQVLDYDIEEDMPYIVMELVEGVTLRTHIRNLAHRSEIIPLKKTARIIREIGQALSYAHQQNMIHRDVKSSNVIVEGDEALTGRAVLTDFGLVKILTAPGQITTDATIGTPAYMAPEQGLGEPGDHRIDIYSFGVVLFEMTTGRLPFEADTLVATMLKHIQEEVPQPHLFNPELTVDIENVIYKSMAKRPEDRYQYIDEMLADLDEALLGLETRPVGVKTGEISSVSRKRLIEVKPPPEPAIPPTTADFVGRQTELVYFAGQLAIKHQIIISGMPGVGKTALAAALAMLVSPPVKIFWHTFHTGEGVNALIWKLAGFLSWRGQSDPWVMLQNAQQTGIQPPPPEVLFDYLFQLLRGQDYLLCFDNFHFVEDDPLLVQFLTRLESVIPDNEVSIMIITSRSVPELAHSADFQPMSGLSREDARSLLELRGLSLPEDLFTTLYTRTEGNAQFLTLAIDSLLRGQDPAQLIRQLPEHEGIEHYLIKAVDEGLNPEEREVMSAVSILMGHPGSRDAISAILEGRSMRRTLNDLSSRYLLSALEGENGKEYTQHALVQVFYYEQLGKRAQQEMHRRAADHYATIAPDPLRAALHYQRAGEITKAVEYATQDVWASINRGQALTLQYLLDQFGENLDDPLLNARLNLARGQVNALLGDSQAAQDRYEAVYNSLEGLSQDQQARSLRARACLGMGEVLQESNPLVALEWLMLGLEALPEGENLLERAIIRIRMGRIHAYQGEYLAAEQELQQGRSELPPEHPMQITALGNLGNLYCARGDTVQGQAFYRDALALAQKLGDQWRIAEHKLNLGIEADIAGQLTEAVAIYQEVLAQAEKLGSLAQRVRTHSLLGIVYIKLGEYEQAEQNLKECIDLARRANLRAHLIYTLPSLADLYLRQGQPASAEPLLVEAEKLSQETGTRLAEVLPEIYRNWALLHLEQGDEAAARTCAETSLQLAMDLESDTDEGIGLRVLGKVQLASQQRAEALASFEKSLSKLDGRDPYEAARTQMTWGECLMAGPEHPRGLELLQVAETTFAQLGARHDLDMVKALLS